MLDQAGALPPDGRVVHAALHFVHGGGRTVLRHQHVPYPFHITRPHAPDPARPDVVSLILQSASGGLYRGDRLRLTAAAGAGALVHLASQAATVVHEAAAPGIAVETRLEAAAGAFLALSTDPYILFPGATLSVQTDVALGAGASVVITEGFATHDPAAANRPFGRLSTGSCVRNASGMLLVDDAGTIEGACWHGPGSPLGKYRAMGTAMILGAAAARVQPAPLENALDALGVLAGATALPHGAGLCVRILAAEGGALGRGLDAVLAAARTAWFGRDVARRR